jgi:hypothetical protein
MRVGSTLQPMGYGGQDARRARRTGSYNDCRPRGACQRFGSSGVSGIARLRERLTCNRDRSPCATAAELRECGLYRIADQSNTESWAAKRLVEGPSGMNRCQGRWG